MSIKIKTAINDNLKNIQDLNLKLFKKEFKEFDNTLNCEWTFSETAENYFKDRINGDGVCFVAIDNEKVVGYLAGGLTQPEGYRINTGKMAELENMFVEEEYRGQGIGGMLADAFMDWCKENAVSRIRVIASANNSGGISFYQKSGFNPHDLVLEKVIK